MIKLLMLLKAISHGFGRHLKYSIPLINEIGFHGKNDSRDGVFGSMHIHFLKTSLVMPSQFRCLQFRKVQQKFLDLFLEKGSIQLTTYRRYYLQHPQPHHKNNVML